MKIRKTFTLSEDVVKLLEILHQSSLVAYSVLVEEAVKLLAETTGIGAKKNEK